MPSNDVLTRNDNGDLSVRTVSATEQATVVNKDDVYTRDTDGNLAVRTVGGSGGGGGSAFEPFPAGWTTNGTTKAFCDDVAADTSATVGKAYLGDVYFSDLPESMVNAEVTVEIMKGTTAQNKVIKLTCTSGNTAPYMWIYTYWNGGSDVSGWISFQPAGEGDFVPQYTTMPEASSSNVGQVVQYIGADLEEQVIASQTVGTGLTNIQVDAEQFNLTGETSKNLIYGNYLSYVRGEKDGNFDFYITDPLGLQTAIQTKLVERGYNDSLDYIAQNLVPGDMATDSGTMIWKYTDSDEQIDLQLVWMHTEGGVSEEQQINVESYNYITFVRHGAAGEDLYEDQYISAMSLTGWSSDVAYYGVTYTGTPVANDVISVKKLAITHNYFYESKTMGTDYIWERVNVQPSTVDSVNGKTGAVVLKAKDVDAVPQYEELPTASADNAGEIAQYSGETDDYTNGYFYKNTAETTPASATLDVVGDTVNTYINAQIDVAVFEQAEQPSGDTSVEFDYSPSIVLGQKSSDTFSIEITDINGLINKISLPDSYFAGFDIGTDYNNSAQFYYMNGHWNFWTRYTRPDGSRSSRDVRVDDYISVTGTASSQDVQYFESAHLFKKNGESVFLLDYGITYGCTATDYQNGDKITVDYTAPVTSYSWNQIDVQPDPDIKWVASVDLPDDFAYGSWNCVPIYTITGGLPDGTYDFYWQNKCAINVNNPLGIVTYHGRMTINNTNHTFYGMFEPIIDKDWLPSDNYIPGNRWFYDFVRTSGSDLMLYTIDEQAWKSNIPDVKPGLAVSECFKISAITNIETGEEYIPTGALYNGSFPQFDWQYNGTMRMIPFAQEPYIPNYHYVNSSEYDSGNRYLIIDTNNQTPIKANGLNPSCSEVDFVASTSNGGTYHVVIENMADRYIARVLEATGDLATAKMYYMPTNSNTLTFDFNSAGNSGTLTYECGLKGSSTGITCYLQDTTNTLTLVDIANVGEAVTFNNIGLIEQYKGTTGGGYTNGYFYKSEGTIVTTPASMVASDYAIEGIPINDVTISINATDLVTVLSAMYGWTPAYTKQQLQQYTNWNVAFNIVDAQIVLENVWWSFMGGIANPALLSCFTVTTTGSYSSYTVVSFTGTYTPESKSVTGGTWTRVDVQPNSLASVMPSVLDVSVGTILQYIGVTDANYTNGYFYKNNAVITPSSATVSQTSGSGLSDLAVNLATFEAEEQPSGSGNTVFEYVDSRVPGSISYVPENTWAFTLDADSIISAIDAQLGSHYVDNFIDGYITTEDTQVYYFYSHTDTGTIPVDITSYITVTNVGSYTPSSQTTIASVSAITRGTGDISWQKSGSDVDIADYGITYTGTPVANDEITVVYTAISYTGGWEQTNVQPLDLTGVTGYDATKTQVLKNIQGTLTWVDE